MNENTSSLDYITFDKFNKTTSDFLDKKLSKNVDNLLKIFQSFSKKISPELYRDLPDEEKLYLILYGYHTFISRKSDPRDSFNDLIQQFEKFRINDDLQKLFGTFLTHLIHKAFLALLEQEKETETDYALILLNKPLPSDIKIIKVMVPIVPIKSPFTIYIVSLITDFMRKISRYTRLEYEINIGWNEVAYGKIMENMQRHFDFDKDLSTRSLQHLIEQNFQTFLHFLILSSQWEIQEEGKVKNEMLRKNLRTVKYDLPLSLSDIPSPIVSADHELSDISKVILQDVSNYIPSKFPHAPPHRQSDYIPNLIEYYGKTILDECSNLQDNQYLLFITPLPVGLMLDYLFKYIGDSKWESRDEKYVHACQRVYYLCYLPFPGTEDIRNELPFYLTEYSYPLYRHARALDAKPKNGKILPKRNYIRRLLISAMKRLHFESNTVSLIDRKDYDEVIDVLTSVFRREDTRQKEYIRYV